MARSKNILLLFALAVLTFFSSATVSAQSGLDRAVALYNEGKYSESITILSAQKKIDKNNATVWNLLGLNYVKTRDLKEARKAFKKAVRLRPDDVTLRGNLATVYLAEGKYSEATKEYDKILKLDPNDTAAYYYRGTAWHNKARNREAVDDAEKSISLDPTFAPPVFLKMDAIMAELFSDLPKNAQEDRVIAMVASARESLNKCLSVCKGSDKTEINRRLESLKAAEDYLLRPFRPDPYPVNSNSERTEITILSKPRPGYTDSARQSNTTGEIVLLVEFRSDGKIGFIGVLKGLPHGLTEQAILAAKRIRFTPAAVDGRPVTVVKTVQFNFSIY